MIPSRPERAPCKERLILWKPERRRKKMMKMIDDCPARAHAMVGGLEVEVREHPWLKHLCGYVLVPRRWKVYGRSCEQLDRMGLHPHGGVTFSEKECRGMWRIGFDCAHPSDVVPGLIGGPCYSVTEDMHLWTVDEVMAECLALAAQIVGIGRRSDCA